MVLQGAIEVMVQLFYAWRVYVLTKNWYLVALVVGFTVVGGGEYNSIL